VNSERGVHISPDGKVELSKIFDWYAADFAKSGGVLSFINQRRTPPLPDGAKIGYQDYDWSLNETR